MNEVDAIKGEENILLMTALLKKHANQDYADIFKIGLNLGFRISDLLGIKYSQIDLNKREVTIQETKTSKNRTVRLNATVIEIIKQRRETYQEDIYLFQSHSNRGRALIKPISRVSVWRRLSEAGHILDLNVGSHSLRKSKGYALFKQGVPIEFVSKILGHQNTGVTLSYIGITKEMVLQSYDDYEL